MNPLDKIFTVIETVVANQVTGLTFSEVAVECGLPKASVHRTLKGLVELGYLTYNPESKKYRGGLRLGALGSEVMVHFQLRDHAHPHLLEMQRRMGHTCNMGIKEGDTGIYIDKVESQDYGIKLQSEIGRSFPLHCTGLGKCLLAWASDREVESVLSRPLKKYNENTIIDPPRVRRKLEEVREAGFAVDHEEITRGIMCVAAPVFGVGNNVIAAISMTFPVYVFSERGIESEIKAILSYAEEIGVAIN